MIKQIFKLGRSIQNILCSTHCGRKIISLYNAYGGKYNFCRFYRNDDRFICIYNSQAILACDKADSELIDFLIFNGVCSIEMPKCASADISITGYTKILRTCYMFCSNINAQTSEIEVNPKLSDVFDIVGHSFNIIENYDAWLADMSHMIRHGISVVYKLNTSVAVCRYCLNNVAYFEQIATAPSDRGKGQAKNLMLAIAQILLKENLTGILYARKEATEFYLKAGFKALEEDYIFERINL